MAYGKALAFCGLAAAALLAGTVARGADDIVDLDQGWTPEQVADWYGKDQGSRLIPKAWFEALEQPDGGGRFLDPAYMAAFRYLIGPDGWPVGFAEDRQDDTPLGPTRLRWLPDQRSDEPWIGMTCAACHTAELRSGGHVMRVQGGPTLADFQSFYFAFTDALSRTRSDPARLARFEAKVLPANATAADRARLEDALDKLVAYQTTLADMNRTHVRYGYSRLDAVGYILNKVSYVANQDGHGANEPDAPVSYPFLWNIGQQDRVQWDGIAANGPSFQWQGRPVDIGALGRNTGEVIGVFADVQTPSFFHPSFHSSVQVVNLVEIEQQVATLKPPRWPRALFPVDDALAAEGKQLFGQHCVSCHAGLSRDDIATRRRADGTSLERLNVLFPQAGTDPGITSAPADTDRWMACNTATGQSDTGRLKHLPTGDRLELFGDRAATSLMLAATVKGADLAKAPELIGAGFRSWRGSHPAIELPPPPLPPGVAARAIAPGAALAQKYAERRAKCDAYARQPESFKEVGYKARPLTGVWATAPYLHNGSVPTLWDLLLPPAQRPASFYLGAREFDPQKVGYRTEPSAENGFRFDAVDAAGQPIEGNSNRGHDYGVGSLTDHQRWALVEYLKVIGE